MKFDSTELTMLAIVITAMLSIGFIAYQEFETKRECIRTPGCVWQR
jgi:hypothetical protein